MPTTRGWGLPAPSYSVVTPEWLSDSQIGLPGPTDVPQGFFRFASVCAASPGISETRFVWAYDRVAIALRPAEAGVTFFFFQAEDGIRDLTVTGVQTCALPI